MGERRRIAKAIARSYNKGFGKAKGSAMAHYMTMRLHDLLVPNFIQELDVFLARLQMRDLYTESHGHVTINEKRYQYRLSLNIQFQCHLHDNLRTVVEINTRQKSDTSNYVVHMSLYKADYFQSLPSSVT